MTFTSLRALAQVPLDPDSDEATDWLVEELGKGEYQAAKPTLWDELVQSINDWLNSLFEGTMGAPIDIFGMLVIGIIVVLVIVLIIMFARPAAARRSAVSSADRVFLEDDTRTAAELRRASEAAAGEGDWALAVTEGFRAIARDLGDRTLIVIRPGTTAHHVAARAATPFPDAAAALTQAANDFDDVRYLDRAGSEAAWQRTRQLDDDLASRRPAALAEFERADA